MHYGKPSAILIGDEIGYLKYLDYDSLKSTTIKLVPDEPVHPSKSIVSIHPLNCSSNSDQYFLISRKDREIFIYDSSSNEVHSVNYINDNKSHLIASRCVDDQNIVMGFKDGTIKRINVENFLCSAQYKPNSKAINLLGINDTTNLESPRKRKRIETNFSLKSSKIANEISNQKQNILTIQNPNWNCENTYLTCLEVNKEKLAIGGYNCDLKVFDIKTGQNIFNAKPVNTDWLGIQHAIWISGIEWIEPDSPNPHLIATCSRSEPYIRIYDIKQRQRKPTMTINLKHINSNESNPLSFTSICSLPSLAYHGQASSSIVVGTTLGRMIAIDLRMNNHTSKILGSFKGFNGGSVRDIKYVRDSQISHKIFSCTIDRFVRIHTLTKSSRTLEKKVYIKTRPTCLYPIVHRGKEKSSKLAEDVNDQSEEEEKFIDDPNKEFI